MGYYLHKESCLCQNIDGENKYRFACVIPQNWIIEFKLIKKRNNLLQKKIKWISQHKDTESLLYFVNDFLVDFF